MSTEKVREIRLRRAAERQGLKISKSRIRDPRAIGYGLWMILNAQTNVAEAGGHGFLNLNEVEKYLTANPGARKEADAQALADPSTNISNTGGHDEIQEIK